MGMFGRVLLTIWLMGGVAGSLYMLTKRFYDIGVRVLHLHNLTCLEDPVWWPTCLMALVLVSCVFGLMAIMCKLKFFQWLFNILVNIGILYVIAIMVWRLLMFGWIRKPTQMAFDEVYKNNSPLNDEYKPRLIEAMASDHVWDDVDECLTEIQFCDKVPGQKLIGEDDWTIEDLYDYFKEGCCIPPSRCAKQLLSIKGLNAEDDCVKWANATIKKPLHVKCYNCNSCKAARMATYQADQDKVRAYSLIAAIFLFVANLCVVMGGFS